LLQKRKGRSKVLCKINTGCFCVKYSNMTNVFLHENSFFKTMKYAHHYLQDVPQVFTYLQSLLTLIQAFPNVVKKEPVLALYVPQVK